MNRPFKERTVPTYTEPLLTVLHYCARLRVGTRALVQEWVEHNTYAKLTPAPNTRDVGKWAGSGNHGAGRGKPPYAVGALDKKRALSRHKGEVRMEATRQG